MTRKEKGAIERTREERTGQTKGEGNTVWHERREIGDTAKV